MATAPSRSRLLGSLTMTTAEALFEKLERDLSSLDADVSADNFFNFVVTAHCMHDWFDSASTVSEKAKKQLLKERCKQHTHLAVCRDVANASKHFRLDSSDKYAVTDLVELKFGYGAGRYGKGSYGFGEPTIQLHLIDGDSYELFEFCEVVLTTWRKLLDARQ